MGLKKSQEKSEQRKPQSKWEAWITSDGDGDQRHPSRTQAFQVRAAGERVPRATGLLLRYQQHQEE